MRILLTADAELPVPPENYGGIERVIASLVEEYRRLGHVVGLVAHAESTVEADCLFTWTGKTSTQLVDSIRNALTLRSATKEFMPDVLHSFSRLAWLLALRGMDHRLIDSGDSRDGAVPFVMSFQREPTGRTVRWSNRIHGDRLSYTACSHQLAEKGKQRGGGRWTAIPNFIDPKSFTFVEKVAKDAPLVFLSRIEPIKGCHRAIAIAKASGRRLLIAGNRVEQGTAAGYWEREIDPHLGKDGIEYVGPVNDKEKNELLGQAAAMVVPIEWDEPFGIVFAESLACGTPVISTPRGSLPEIIEHGLHGFLIDDLDAGIEAISRLENVDRFECRNRAIKKFSLQVVGQKYLNLYSSL